MADDIQTLRRILRENRVIAVVGLSANWYRPSFFAAKYMMEHGYTIIPVNPAYKEVLGQKCYASLRDIPGEGGHRRLLSQDRGNRAHRRGRDRHRRQGAVAAARRPERSGRAQSRGRGAGHGDGPLRENRARAPVRRPELGRREHEGDFGEAARAGCPTEAWTTSWQTENSASTPCACTRDRSPTRPPARARCRSTRPPPSCSTRPTTRRACSTCRPSATSIRACRIRPRRCSRSASRRSKAGARRSRSPPARRRK